MEGRVDILEPLAEFAFETVCAAADGGRVGLRLADEHGGFPLVRWYGFREEFVRRILRDDHEGDGEPAACLCFRLCRRPSRERLGPYCRPSGAWVSNDLPQDLERLRREIGGFPLACACEEEGFRSLAVFPLETDPRPMARGLLIVAEARPAFFDGARLARLESLASGFSRLLERLDGRMSEMRGRYRVLVVEDDEIVARLWAKVLGRFGYVCTVCGNGDAAWTLLQEERFHVVVADLMLPRLGGLELLRRLRERYGMYGPEVVVVTARPEMLDDGAKARFRVAKVIAKPLGNVFALAATVADLVGC